MNLRKFISKDRVRSSADALSSVKFIPLLTAAVYPFSFPFGKKGNLRNAIDLTFRPLLGDLTSTLSVSPQIIEETNSLTRGAAWYASKDELAEYEKKYGAGYAFIPLPLAFAAKVAGNGIIICNSEGILSAAVLKNYMPLFYRAMPENNGTSEELCQWIKAYLKSAGKENITNEFICDSNELTHEYIKSAASASFTASPSISHIDLSSTGANSAERCEKFIVDAASVIKIISYFGIILLIFSSVLLYQSKYLIEKYNDSPSDIYRHALGERSRAPLSDALKKMRAINISQPQVSFNGALANIAAAWSDESVAAAGIELDNLRYGAERIELEGRAKKTEDVQKLRDSLSENGFSAKLGDVQQVSGKMRFTISLTRTELRGVKKK